MRKNCNVVSRQIVRFKKNLWSSSFSYHRPCRLFLLTSSTRHEKTFVMLQQVALSAWDDVIAYTFESSPAFLMLYYQESLSKYEDEYARAMELLADEGDMHNAGR